MVQSQRSRVRFAALPDFPSKGLELGEQRFMSTTEELVNRKVAALV
jgi:hypothetical protein